MVDLYRDHEAFLDICWNNGENPVYAWLTYALHANWDYVQHATQPASGYAFQTLDVRYKKIEFQN